MSENHLFDLVCLAQQGDREAMNQIILLFKPVIRKLIGKASLQERFDLEQIISEKIIRAVQRYDIFSTPDFTFFCKSIDNFELDK